MRYSQPWEDVPANGSWREDADQMSYPFVKGREAGEGRAPRTAREPSVSFGRLTLCHLGRFGYLGGIRKTYSGCIPHVYTVHFICAFFSPLSCPSYALNSVICEALTNRLFLLSTVLGELRTACDQLPHLEYHLRPKGHLCKYFISDQIGMEWFLQW